MLDLLLLGCGFGLGWVTCHATAVRPLIKLVTHMRYTGFMGDPKPEKPSDVKSIQRPRED